MFLGAGPPIASASIFIFLYLLTLLKPLAVAAIRAPTTPLAAPVNSEPAT